MTRPPPPAVETRIAAFLPELQSFLRRRIACRATADDLAQDTVLKALRSRATLRDEGRLEAWLYQTARRTLIDHVRRRRPIEETPVEDVMDPHEGGTDVAGIVARAASCYLGTLPERYREPVRLAGEGMTLEQIARRLDLSLTAVKARVRRGRAQIRAAMEKCCRFEFDTHGRVVDYELRRGGSRR